jgi:hypothetical protein
MPAIDFIIVFPLTPPLTVEDGFGFMKSAIVEQENVAAGRESLCQLVGKNLKGVRIQAGQLQKEAFSGGGSTAP